MIIGIIAVIVGAAMFLAAAFLLMCIVRVNPGQKELEDADQESWVREYAKQRKKQEQREK